MSPGVILSADFVEHSRCNRNLSKDAKPYARDMEGYTYMVDTPQSPIRRISWTRILTYSIVAIGTVLNLLFIVPNGDFSCQQGVCGIRIGEWHYHDAMWHIAVARNSFTAFPFVFPSAAGFALTSYNYLLGAILFVLEKLWISPFFSYFKLLPVVGNIALVYTLFRYYRLTKKTELEQLWITFFTYLGSSFSYFLIFYRNDFVGYSILKGFPVVATLQPAFVTSNIQFFLTLPILIYVFTNIIARRKSKYSIQIHCLLLVFAVGLKIYSGVLALLILMVGAISKNILERKYVNMLTEIGCYLLTFIGGVLLFFLPFSKQNIGYPFLWNPIAIPHAITESPGLFYQKEFTLGRYFMYGVNTLSPRLILYESISILLFILWNLGTRIIGILEIPYAFIRRRFKLENLLLTVIGLTCVLIPAFFIQRGGGWYNTIQFAYIGIYFMGIVAAMIISKLWNTQNILAKVFVLSIVALTIPNNILMLKLIAKEKETVSSQEIQALSLLKKQPSGIVLSFPDYKNSSYVPALSGKVGYMIDYEQAALLNLPTEQMVKDVENRDCKVLAKVDYVYFSTPQGREYTQCPAFKPRFKQIYRKGAISIYGKR